MIFVRDLVSGVKLSAPVPCYTGMYSETGSERYVGYADSPEHLARGLAAGDPGAPRKLVERHHAELYRYARALLRDGPAALGGYSEARIEALSLRPWLYRITLNVVRNVWRDSRREVTVAEMPEGIDERPETGGETWLDTLKALDRLPERQRVAVTLRYLEDLPYAGISTATGWPENTCKTLVRRGVSRLGATLSESPGGPDAKGAD